LDPGVEPIAEADRRGTILAIIRLGGIDLEMPQALTSSSSGLSGEVIQMADGSSGQEIQGTEDTSVGRATVRR
jgi:hypothetical protein